MRGTLLSIWICLLPALVPAETSCPVPVQSESSAAKLAELDALPVGLTVIHTPNPVKADWDGRRDVPCRWIFETAVSAAGSTVTIEEFGSFFWTIDHWEFSNVTKKPFTRKNFAEWYGCPDGVLRPGETRRDASNWVQACSARQGRSRWYYIGVDADGRRVKGEAVIELAGEYED